VVAARYGLMFAHPQYIFSTPGHRMKTRESKGRVSKEREEEQRQQQEQATAIFEVCQLRTIG
jgi:hypothetical protein